MSRVQFAHAQTKLSSGLQSCLLHCRDSAMGSGRRQVRIVRRFISHCTTRFCHSTVSSLQSSSLLLQLRSSTLVLNPFVLISYLYTPRSHLLGTLHDHLQQIKIQFSLDNNPHHFLRIQTIPRATSELLSQKHGGSERIKSAMLVPL